MKNPNSKSNKINIIFSSFLVIGYIICTYFFSSIASQVTGTWGTVIQILIMAVFGLLLFYATRVGEGKQVKRFSLAVLLLIDIPALYIILAALIPWLPLHNLIVPQNATMAMMGIGSSGPSIILMLACVALGYGIPYTFFSGYEMKEEGEEAEEKAEETPVLDGGLAEELAETEKDAEAKADEAVAEASENAEEAAKEAVEETAEEAEEIAEEAAEAKEESEKEAE